MRSLFLGPSPQLKFIGMDPGGEETTTIIASDGYGRTLGAIQVPADAISKRFVRIGCDFAGLWVEESDSPEPDGNWKRVNLAKELT